MVQLEDLIGLKVQALVNDHERKPQELVDTRVLLEAAIATGPCPPATIVNRNADQLRPI